MKTGSESWLKKLLKDTWERTRRNPDYIEFCEAHAEEFDEDGTMDWLLSLEPEAEEVVERFGLELIYHPTKDISEDQMLEWPVFREPLAVSYEWREDESGHPTPIWDGNYIRLKINFHKKNSQILDEVKEFVEQARQWVETNEENNKEKRRHFLTRLKCYQAWDCVWDWGRLKAKKPFSEIARELGLTKDLAKTRFYSEFELITGRPYDRYLLRELIRRKLERRVRNKDGNWNEEVLEELLDLEDTKQQHYLVGKRGERERADSEEDGPSHVEDWGAEEADRDSPYAGSEELLLRDVRAMCKKCENEKCRRAFLKADETKQFEMWKPDCPSLYALLTQK